MRQLHHYHIRVATGEWRLNSSEQIQKTFGSIRLPKTLQVPVTVLTCSGTVVITSFFFFFFFWLSSLCPDDAHTLNIVWGFNSLHIRTNMYHSFINLYPTYALIIQQREDSELNPRHFTHTFPHTQNNQTTRHRLDIGRSSTHQVSFRGKTQEQDSGCENQPIKIYFCAELA